MKKIEALNVIAYSQRLKLSELQMLVGVVPQDIVNVAIENGFAITGCQIWAYDGCDGKPDTTFDLKICLPVDTAGRGLDHPRYFLDTLPEAQVEEAIYQGDWSMIGQTYCSLFSKMVNQGQIPNGRTREIYQQVDFEHPENNITEVQVEF
jgi:hypothetical protein